MKKGLECENYWKMQMQNIFTAPSNLLLHGLGKLSRIKMNTKLQF